MDRNQARAENKVRQLIIKAAKEKDIIQLELLLPIIQLWVKDVTDERSHSIWFWEDLEKRFEKEYDQKRYFVPSPTTTINEVSAERPSSSESKEETKADESKNSTAKTEQVHTTRKTRRSKKDVSRGI